MLLKLSATSPFVGGVVVIDISEQEARSRLVDDQPDIRVDTHGPEIRVSRAVELMKRMTRCRRVHLQVEGCGFCCSLLAAR
ncbi:hypothetical protein, partial [Rhodomicrobium udaipurense]